MKIQKKIVKHEDVSLPIPIINSMIRSMTYASHERIMFMTLVFSGGRISELDNFTGVLYEHPQIPGFAKAYLKTGKNQPGYREIVFPDYYIREYDDYLALNAVPRSKMFGISSDAFCKRMRRNRRNFAPEWDIHCVAPNCKLFSDQHLYTLKCLRKTYITFHFYKLYQEWKSAEVALQLICAEMKHSGANITAQHYIRDIYRLNLPYYSQFEYWELFRPDIQMKMTDYSVQVIRSNSALLEYV